MNTQELKVNYKKLLNKAAQANGRKETVSYLTVLLRSSQNYTQLLK